MTLPPILQRLGPPLAVFLLVRIMIGIAALSLGLNPLDPETLSRWDSGHYLHIADAGYELFRCAAINLYNPEDWCGNTGWLPAYPWLMRLLSFTSLLARHALNCTIAKIAKTLALGALRFANSTLTNTPS